MISQPIIAMYYDNIFNKGSFLEISLYIVFAIYKLNKLIIPINKQEG